MKQLDPYEFDYIGGKDSTYLFTAQRGITYELRFKPTGYLFDSAQPFVNSIFEMVLLPINPDVDNQKPLDARIMPTVFAIIEHFFVQQEKVLLYLCENKDGKGAARARKFSQWFRHYGMDEYFKFDFTITDGYERYLNSVIGKLDNPFKAEITLACFELVDNNSK